MKIVANRSSAARSVTARATPDDRVTYPFPLRPDMLVELRIPRTLRPQDYERLCAFLLTLVER